MYEVCNNTKCGELRLVMLSLSENDRPAWRTKDINGFVCELDRDWYYHFSAGGYKTIEWCEIKLTKSAIKDQVVFSLSTIGLVGQIIEDAIIVYGFVDDTGKLNKITAT